jgi:competence protein ComEA
MENMRMPEISRTRALAYLAAVLAALVVGGRFLVGSGDDGTATPEGVGATLAIHGLEPAIGTTGAQDALLVVHVAGAVRQPGVYELPDGSRVEDAITAAGGARPGARLELLNLAAQLVDGQQVLVPRRGSPPPAGPSSGAPAGAPPAPVRLNTASVEELDALPGIGPVTAQNIVDYRSEHGPFASIEELDAIPGIGPARLEQLRELVSL